MLIADSGQFLDALWDWFPWIHVGSEGILGLHSHPPQSNCSHLGDFFQFRPEACSLQVEYNQLGDSQKRVEVAVMGWIQGFHESICNRVYYSVFRQAFAGVRSIVETRLCNSIID